MTISSDNTIRDYVEKTLAAEMIEAEPSTIRNYSVVCRQFLAFTGKTSGFTRDDILRFLDSKRQQGKAKGYLRFMFTALKTFLQAINEEMPIPRRKVPGPRQHEMNRPVLSPYQVRKIIIACKDNALEPLSVSLVAFASIYGFRRVELSNLEIVGTSRVKVITAKTKAPREHRIPEQILPFITGYYHISTPEMSNLFHEVVFRSGLDRILHGGWHTFRRAVATGLLDNSVIERTVETFMAWSPSKSKSLAWYYTPQAETVDNTIFKNHPFLEWWS